MIRWRRYNFVFAAVACTAAALVVVFNFAVDPLYQYRHPSWFGRGYYPQDRLLVAGLARQLRYEAVIIGSSYSQNFRASAFTRILGRPSAKLAVAGSTAREQRLVLEVALATGQVRQVIWEVAPGNFSGAAERLNELAYFPMYLYRRSPLTPVRYLLSGQTTSIGWDFIRGKYYSELDEYNVWDRRFPPGRDRVIADWCRRGLRPIDTGAALATIAVRELQDSVDQNLLAVVRAHPEIRFDAWLPPFSYAAYQLQAHAYVLVLRSLLVAATAEHGNLRVHDFQSERTIVLDLNRYKDETHFDGRVSAWLTSAIRAETHLLTPANRSARDRDLRGIMETPLGFSCDAPMPGSPPETVSRRPRWHDPGRPATRMHPCRPGRQR